MINVISAAPVSGLMRNPAWGDLRQMVSIVEHHRMDGEALSGYCESWLAHHVPLLERNTMEQRIVPLVPIDLDKPRYVRVDIKE